MFVALVDVVDTMLKGSENVDQVGVMGVVFLALSLFGPLGAAFVRSTRFHQAYALFWGACLVAWILYSQGVLRG